MRAEIIAGMEAHERKCRHPGLDRNFGRLQYLVSLEEEFRRLDPKTPPIPFHQVLLRSSRLYGRAWDLGQAIGVNLKPATKSMLHFYLEFKPFTLDLEYPAHWQHIRWLFQSAARTPELNQEITNTAAYNWSIFHDALHLVFLSLVPCETPSELMLYFHFFESFVGVQEALLTAELEGLYEPLCSFGVLNKAPAFPEASLDAPLEVFVNVILDTFRGRLIPQSGKSRSKKWGAKHWISEAWFKNYSRTAKVYPLELSNRTFPAIQKFHFPSYDPDWLARNRGVLQDFVHWYKSVIISDQIKDRATG